MFSCVGLSRGTKNGVNTESLYYRDRRHLHRSCTGEISVKLLLVTSHIVGHACRLSTRLIVDNPAFWCIRL